MKTTCLYCGFGCAVDIECSENKITSANPLKDAPPNYGKLCRLGSTLPKVFNSPDRLTEPNLRQGNEMKPCSWKTALDAASDRLSGIIEQHGPNSVAFYGGATNLTEEYYVMNKLMKGAIGTNNMECSTRICMSSTAAGFLSVFGADAPPTCYEDIDHADCFLICGNNMAVSCPVLFGQIIESRDKRGAKIIVVDPRKTATAAEADLHLQIAPGTDVALNNAMAHVLFKEGYVNEEVVDAYASGLQSLKEHIDAYDPEKVAPIVGCAAEKIRTAAMMYGDAKTALTLWFQGYNHSTSALSKNNTLHNLAIITGNIGQLGGGPLSITGESNAMGNRYVGALCHLLPGMRQVINPAHRKEITDLWQIPPDRLQPLPGSSIIEMIHDIHAGRIKALWLMNTNPAASLPHTAWAEEAFKKLDLMIVQDIFPTETTGFADILLPAAQWYEKQGTIITSERRVEYIPKLIDPPGEAWPDCKIMQEIASRMGYEDLLSFQNEEEIFEEWKTCTRGKLCDMNGINYDRLRGKSGIQLPCPSKDHPGTARLFTDLRFEKADHRAALLSRDQQDAAEMPDELYPFIFLTGRTGRHFNTGTRTIHIPEAGQKDEWPFIEIHPRAAQNIGIADKDPVAVLSRRGRCVAKARITDTIREEAVFMPWHYGKLLSRNGGANLVTNPAIDPGTKQPEYKLCAVKIEKITANE
ncbi:MAG: molybdopterin-dependent oxidoreductase [Deltaproteobacteria bacterium]|nr:molybdopterin-dependent oxidoreductase [Deltaproteobacteria bacterium]